MTAPGPQPAESSGDSGTNSGDDACWLDEVCDECGGFIEPDRDHVCRQPAPNAGIA